MDKWNEELFNNLSRLVNKQKSRAASSSPNQYDNAIPIAISYSSGLTDLITRSSKAASVGGTWTKKTRLRTTPAEDLRAMMFG
jgi:hypothetical protein